MQTPAFASLLREVGQATQLFRGQFAHLETGPDNSACLIGVLSGVNGLIGVKHLQHCLEQSKLHMMGLGRHRYNCHRHCLCHDRHL